MPSQFESAMAANLDTLNDAFGLAAVYTAPDGTVTTGLMVRVQRHESRQVERPNKAVGEMQTAVVIVREADLLPVKGGRFVVESIETWTIEVTPTRMNGEHICACAKTGVSRLMPREAKE